MPAGMKLEDVIKNWTNSQPSTARDQFGLQKKKLSRSSLSLSKQWSRCTREITSHSLE